MNEIGGGLQKLKKDKRDFRLSSIDTPVNLSYLPEEYEVLSLEVKDQGNSDYCTAYTVTSASEVHEGKELSPLYQFAKTKQIEGNISSWGANLRDACKSAVKYGSLPVHEVPADLASGDRGAIADWASWPDKLDSVADVYRKKSYFAVDGYGSVYDAIKAHIWLHREEGGVVMTGALWRHEWTWAERGVIPKHYTSAMFGHAFLFTGWKKIDGTEYLVAHLSNGTAIGDKGKFYFPREVVEREIGNYGVFMFVDMRPEDYKREKWTFWQKVSDFLYRRYGYFFK